MEKYTLVGVNEHSIHRGKSQFTNVTLFKLGVSEVVNKGNQTIRECLGSLKTFRNL